jgi:hypothetical protein
MRSLHSVLVATFAGLVVLVGGGAGCSMLSNAESGSDEGSGTGIAEVDRIDAPEQIAATDTLTVQFYGTVGPNGCYSFNRFETERSGSQLTVTPRVQYRGGEDTMCTMAIVPLEETYRAEPPFESGPLTIKVPQPDGADVTATVEVTADGR